MPQETENDQVQDPVNGHGDEQPKESVDDGRATNEEIERELLGDDALSETEQLQQQLAESNDQVLRIQAECKICAAALSATSRTPTNLPLTGLPQTCCPLWTIWSAR